jgi:hypothetical protein
LPSASAARSRANVEELLVRRNLLGPDFRAV